MRVTEYAVCTKRRRVSDFPLSFDYICRSKLVVVGKKRTKTPYGQRNVLETIIAYTHSTPGGVRLIHWCITRRHIRCW